MKKILDLATKLGYKIDTNADKFLILCQIHKWLIEQKIIMVIPVAVNKDGPMWAFRLIDARSGFYNVKAETKYEFKEYKLALEASVWSGLTYLQ